MGARPYQPQIKWGFRDMQVGDSVHIPASHAARARAAARKCETDWLNPICYFAVTAGPDKGGVTITRIAQRPPRPDMDAQREEYMKDPIYRKLMGVAP